MLKQIYCQLKNEQHKHVENALLKEAHWFLKFPASLNEPLKFPVLAGLSVNGEEKNCEKLASCAQAQIQLIISNKSMVKRFNILII